MPTLRDRWKTLFRNQSEDNVKKPQAGTEIGFTGSRIFAGLPMDEYNPDLSFPRSTEVYDKMRRSDGQIAAILEAVTLPIQSTKWYVKPDDSDGVDENLAQDIADFVEDMLFDGMKYSWDEHIREALLMVVFGFSVFEEVLKMDTWNGKPVITIDKFAPRIASSIWRFPQDENYEVAAIEQINYMTGQIKSIPLDRCLVYTHKREGSNPVGISMLRAAYKHWYIKDALIKIMATGIEKTLIGTPYASVPKNYSGTERDKILDVITAIRAAEEAGFTVPNDVEIKSIDSAGSAGVQTMSTAFLEYQDTQIARSILAQFINLGTMASASGGSYALGTTMVDLFVLGLEQHAKYIEGQVQKRINRIVEFNWGADAPMPKLCHERISTLFMDTGQLAQAIYWLGAGHVLTPDEALENKVRDRLGIEPISRVAIDEKLMLPQDRYNPDILNSGSPLSPAELEAIKLRQQSGGGQGNTNDSGANNAAAASANTAAMSEAGKGDSMKFSDGETPKWRRDLNDREKVVKWDEINGKLDTMEESFIRALQTVLRTASSQYIDQVQLVLNSKGLSTAGKITAIARLPLPMAGQVSDVIKNEISSVYEYGKQSVQQELKKPNVNVTTPAADTASMNTQAQTIADAQTAKLLQWLQTTATSSLSRELSTAQVVAALQTGANSFVYGANTAGEKNAANPQLKSLAMVTVAENFNVGRSSTAKQLGIKGAMWSAILDSKTCHYCEQLDEKQISVDDPDFDLFRPPAHPYCRCVWVYIDEEEEGTVFDWKTPHVADIKKYAPVTARFIGLDYKD